MSRHRLFGVFLLICGIALIYNAYITYKSAEDEGSLAKSWSLRPLVGGIFCVVGGIYMLIVG